MNPYYNHTTGVPAELTRGTSSLIRNEFDLVGTGFDDVYAQIAALAAAVGIPISVTEAPLASAATTDIGNGYGPVISITGTATITSFGTHYISPIFIKFAGALTLTHSATLVCPGAENIVTEAGDVCIVAPLGNPASGWRITHYARMSKGVIYDTLAKTTGAALVGSDDGSSGSIWTTVQGFINKILSSVGSAYVGFIQSGTGAVATTVQSKLRESVSVKDFGVVGDGSDETTKLRNAIAVLGPGKSLSLEGLTITVSDYVEVLSKSNFTIDGKGGTIIAENGMAVSASKGLLYLTNCTKFTVKNLNLDANRANRTPASVAAHTVTLTNCQKFTLQNIVSNNAVVDGFYFAATTNTDTSTYCRDFLATNCFADNCYRNGASVINAYDFTFIGGAFTTSNGTAPQAGIDVESNAGPTLGNRGGRFIGVRFESNTGGGLQISNVGGAQEFTVDSCYFGGNYSGIDSYTNATHISKCVFKNHANAGNSTGVVRIANEALIKSSSVKNCEFSGNTIPGPAIFVGASASGVSIIENHILDHVNGVGISNQSSSCTIEKNKIDACGGIGISTSGTDNVIEKNTVSSATGRGIYDAGTRSRILSNTIADVSTVVGAYIQAAGVDPYVVGNTMKAAGATAVYGLRIDATALAVHGNICVNLDATDPYTYITSFTDEMAFNNAGGTANDRRRVKMGMGFPSYTTAARPVANTVSVGQTIFNTTTQKLNTSDGTANWYNADGTVA